MAAEALMPNDPAAIVRKGFADVPAQPYSYILGRLLRDPAYTLAAYINPQKAYNGSLVGVPNPRMSTKGTDWYYWLTQGINPRHVREQNERAWAEINKDADTLGIPKDHIVRANLPVVYPLDGNGNPVPLRLKTVDDRTGRAARRLRRAGKDPEPGVYAGDYYDSGKRGFSPEDVLLPSWRRKFVPGTPEYNRILIGTNNANRPWDETRSYSIPMTGYVDLDRRDDLGTVTEEVLHNFNPALHHGGSGAILRWMLSGHYDSRNRTVPKIPGLTEFDILPMFDSRQSSDVYVNRRYRSGAHPTQLGYNTPVHTMENSAGVAALVLNEMGMTGKEAPGGYAALLKGMIDRGALLEGFDGKLYEVPGAKRFFNNKFTNENTGWNEFIDNENRFREAENTVKARLQKARSYLTGGFKTGLKAAPLRTLGMPFQKALQEANKYGWAYEGARYAPMYRTNMDKAVRTARFGPDPRAVGAYIPPPAADPK